MARRKRVHAGGGGDDLQRPRAEGRDGLRGRNSQRRRPSRNDDHSYQGKCLVLSQPVLQPNVESQSSIRCLIPGRAGAHMHFGVV